MASDRARERESPAGLGQGMFNLVRSGLVKLYLQVMPQSTDILPGTAKVGLCRKLIAMSVGRLFRMQSHES